MCLMNALLLQAVELPTVINQTALLDFLIRFAFNFLVAYIIIRWIYYPIHKNKDYFFTYFLFNIIIFVLCYLLKSTHLQIGVAFGLFAVFSILRYRTMNVSIVDMTYLFMIISLAVINALSKEDISIIEVVLANVIVVTIVYVMEHIWLVRHPSSKVILYEKIENIKPENFDKLLADVRQRTGLNVHRIEIGRIDFMRDVARIRIFYFD